MGDSNQTIISSYQDVCCRIYYFNPPGVFLIMSLVVAPPADVFLLLLSPEDLVEV